MPATGRPPKAPEGKSQPVIRGLPTYNERRAVEG